jgi:hypothetical protein
MSAYQNHSPYPASQRLTLRQIVDQMKQTPRGQFNLYLVDNVPSSRQQELVSYRGTARRGEFKRISMAASTGVRVPADQLYEWMAADMRTYFYAFYTFFTAPAFGMYQQSENTNYLNNHQLTFPTPVRELAV